MSTDAGRQVALPPWVDVLAKRFHESYERQAPAHGYETREASAVPWMEVPEQNKVLMRAVMVDLFQALVGSQTLLITNHTAAAIRADLGIEKE